MHALLSIVIASIASVTVICGIALSPLMIHTTRVYQGDGRSALYVSSPEQNSFTTPDEEMFLEVEIDDETSNAASTVWLDGAPDLSVRILANLPQPRCAGEMIFEMSDSAYTLPLPSLPLGQHQLSVHVGIRTRHLECLRLHRARF